MTRRSRNNITDEREEAISQRFLDEKRRKYDEDIKAVMRTAVGRRFVWRLLDDTTQFFGVCGSNVALELARHEGLRLVGQHIKNEVMRVAPADWVHMYQEAVQAQAEEALRREEAQAQEE